MSMPKRQKIAIIGAGIAGLTCAYELKKAGLDVTVFEKENYVGGRMVSRKKGGLIFDIGADHLCNLYKHTKAYCKELRIPWRKVKFLDYALFKEGKVINPKKAVGLISKLRLALQFLKMRRVLDFFNLTEVAQYDTDNAYSYMKRKTGREVSDYLVDSFTSTYQFHGADEISLGALFGILGSIKNEESKWHLHYMEGGMSALPEALAERLDVRKGEEIQEVITGDSIEVKTAEKSERFDAVVLATTADIALKILKNPNKHQQDLLGRTEYSSTISVSFHVPSKDLPEISIVWVPHVESKSISGYVNESMKGQKLLNTWLHEDFAKKMIDESNQEVFKIVKKELLKVCPWIESEEDLENFDLQRWHKAMPKFSHGHLTRVANFLKGGHQGENNVFLCGDYMNSPWIEGSLRCGKRTAKQLLAGLR